MSKCLRDNDPEIDHYCDRDCGEELSAQVTQLKAELDKSRTSHTARIAELQAKLDAALKLG